MTGAAGSGRTRLPGLAATALLAGCQAQVPQSCRLGLATEVPLVAEGGHAIATPLLDGKATPMIFDTGAQLTTLTTQAAQRLSLPLEALNGAMEGIGGSRSAYSFVARTMQLGRLRGRNFRLAAADMKLAGKDGIDGLLGADFLAAYDVDLDLPQSKAVLYRPAGDCAAPAAALAGSLFYVDLLRNENPNDPRPHVTIEIAGKRMTALVDTGAPTTVLFRGAANRLGLPLDSLTWDRHFKLGGAGPRLRDAARHVMTPITIGEITVSNMPVAIIDQHALSDADALIGLDFLRRVHAWFSFSSHTLIMQYPPLPSGEDPS